MEERPIHISDLWYQLMAAHADKPDRVIKTIVAADALVTGERTTKSIRLGVEKTQISEGSLYFLVINRGPGNLILESPEGTIMVKSSLTGGAFARAAIAPMGIITAHSDSEAEIEYDAA
jgi:S1-C subfamily serine protease